METSRSFQSQPVQEFEPPSAAILGRVGACLPCRRRKQRCSSDKPACEQCVRGNRAGECIYEPKRFTKEERLQLRVEELEAMINSYNIQSRDHSSSPQSLSFGMQPQTASSPASSASEIHVLLGKARLSPGSSSQLAALPPGKQHYTPRASTSFAGGSEECSSLLVTNETTSHLFDTFFTYSYQFNFPYPEHAFRQSFASYSAPSPAHPHPALLNAIFLIGCKWSDSQNMSDLEPIFLSRSLRHLDESLALVDRLLDFLVATTLISRYSFVVGREARATYMASSAMTFSKSCGLHRLPRKLGDTTLYDGTTYLLPPPQTEQELTLRIRVWWSIYLLDKDASLFTGLPTNIADEEIYSPWPNPMRLFYGKTHSQGLIGTNRTAAPNANTGIPLYHVGIYEQIMEYMDEDDVSAMVLFCVKAKAMSLLHACMRESRKLSQNPINADWQSFWNTYHELDTALTAFQKHLPPLNVKGELDGATIAAHWRFPYPQSQSRIEDRAINITRHLHTFLFAQSCVYGATIALHGMLANSNENERALVSGTAGKMAELARLFALGDSFSEASGSTGAVNVAERTIYLFVAPVWNSALLVLRRDLELAASSPDPLRRFPVQVSSPGDKRRLLKEQAEILTRALMKLKRFYVSLSTSSVFHLNATLIVNLIDVQ
ncbi:uncharacterized protein EI90DRAFT_3130001 [Cantharellus anzutake]|uniref:uncharacterized protein n=1 Tax=Cantharellus anzutake TaxID=1750568 RepID=UPI0019069D58|nr:uncharacterized protein EI90DRAFT_3130001 [Cantharellus anzutake]KAF8324299.1 hypothetical protein EI90DRAFT_3130001 [Cantharellus anzutake]